jgi:hypothetical protein
MLRAKVIHLNGLLENEPLSSEQVVIYATKDSKENDIIVVQAWHEIDDGDDIGIHLQQEIFKVPKNLIDSYISDFSEGSAISFVRNFNS